jgi:KDO2-lipid IV(A) lauroyltransferase
MRGGTLVQVRTGRRADAFLHRAAGRVRRPPIAVGRRPPAPTMPAMLNRLLVPPLLGLFRRLAADTVSRVGGSLGILVFHLGIRRRVASRTMAEGLQATGWRRRDLIRRSYASMGASFLELWAIGGVDGPERHVRIINPAWLQLLLARSPSYIFLTGHLGNWEMGAHSVALLRPFIAYAKAQHNAVIDQLANRQRGALGIEVRHAEHGARTAAARIMRALRTGCMLGLMADQAPGSREGQPGYFLGIPTFCFPGPAFFAQRAGVPVVASCCLRRRAGRFAVFLGRPLLPAEIPERVLHQVGMDLLSALIARFPSQYFWQHRRFKDHLDLPPRAEEPWRRYGLRAVAFPAPLIAAVRAGLAPAAPLPADRAPAASTPASAAS